jgi:putative tricarboxylic transport membrane protein
MTSCLARSVAASLLLTMFGSVAGAVECIVPSKPGGAMDITCKLAQKGLQALPASAQQEVRISYLPGGIGAVAWHTLVSQRRAEADTLVVFSGGSLLNLAQGKFGKASAADVRWVAALGVDYGMIAVRADAPFKTLGDLMAALKRDPDQVLIGVSGTIGSQDWVKMALLVKQAGIDPKVLRFVALEGGGEAFTAMQAGHVQVVSGDASEANLYVGTSEGSHQGSNQIRVLAVLSEQRLPGKLAQAPTAREQGIDLVWPVIRGLWMGPQVSDADYRKWVVNFDTMLASTQFAQARAAYGLYPFALSGDRLTAHVKKAVADYGKRATELGLMR